MDNIEVCANNNIMVLNDNFYLLKSLIVGSNILDRNMV